MDYKNCTVLSATVYVYCLHRRFFYLDNFQNFKLFASWYMSEEGNTLSASTESVGPQLPWYRMNYEVQELAKILKCTEQEMLELLENEYE